MKYVLNFRHPLRADQRVHLSTLLDQPFVEICREAHFDAARPDFDMQVTEMCLASAHDAGGGGNVIAIVPPGLGAAAYIVGRWFRQEAPQARVVWFYREDSPDMPMARWIIGGIG